MLIPRLSIRLLSFLSGVSTLAIERELYLSTETDRRVRVTNTIIKGVNSKSIFHPILEFFNLTSESHTPIEVNRDRYLPWGLKNWDEFIFYQSQFPIGEVSDSSISKELEKITQQLKKGQAISLEQSTKLVQFSYKIMEGTRGT